jgi:uncharacterized protein YbjT (DUF2867 family)
MSKKILVIGGTGMLGRPVALKLIEAGNEVSVLTRNIESAKSKLSANLNFEKGDVNDIQSLKEAMKGCYGVHINLSGGSTSDGVFETEYLGVVNIIDAAKASGIKKVTMITGATVSEKNSGFPSIDAKQRAEEYVRSGGIDYTIFKPSWFFESLPLFVRNGKAMLIGNNPNKYFWVAAEDYANLVVKAYENSGASNKSLVVYGLEAMTIEEAMKRYIGVQGNTIKVSKVPIGFMKFLGVVAFNPMLRYVARLSEYFETVGDTGDNSETVSILGKCETALEEWARKI